MILSPASDEQNDIVSTVMAGTPIYVDAVAGSGKTTTVCHMAKTCCDKTILLVTYNKHLKLEVRKKMTELGIHNVATHTYHSIAVLFYDRSAYTDDKLQNIITNDTSKACIRSRYDIIVIDEAQDMTPLYYTFIHKFIRDSYEEDKPLMVIMGDKHQSIYQFNGADSRYLTLSIAGIYGNNVMQRKTLQMSYRVTDSIGWFVNNVMLGEKRLKTCRSGPKVDYIVSNAFTAYQYIFQELYHLLQTKKILPEDIFVLCPSIKKNGMAKTPAGYLENAFVKHGIPCFVPVSDTGNLDDDVIKGKVVFTTFHQSKGRERPIVIVYNFDGNYFKFFNKEDDPYMCPSTLYVAATRASQRLMVVEDCENGGCLPFLKMSYTEMSSSGHVKVVNLMRRALPSYEDESEWRDDSKDDSHKNVVVTDIVKYIKQDVLTELQKSIDILFTTVKPCKRKIRIPSKIPSKVTGLFEEVSTINALTMTSIWEYKYTNSIHIYNNLRKAIRETKVMDEVVITAFQSLRYPCEDLGEYMKLATIYETEDSGYHFKLAQIPTYDWLTDKMTLGCVKRLEDNIDFEKEKYVQIEYRLEEENEPGIVVVHHKQYGKLHFKGRVDILTDDAIWEIKCVEELQIEHYLQVILYAYIWSLLIEKEHKPIKDFYIINIRTGEVKQLNISSGYIIEDVVNTILSAKFGRNKTISNEEFIERCMRVFKN